MAIGKKRTMITVIFKTVYISGALIIIYTHYSQGFIQDLLLGGGNFFGTAKLT